MPDVRLEPIDAYRYRIPRDAAAGMRTDVIVYASALLIEQIQKDQSLTQAMNVATLPGIVGPSLAMPDIHPFFKCHLRLLLNVSLSPVHCSVK